MNSMEHLPVAVQKAALAGECPRPLPGFVTSGRAAYRRPILRHFRGQGSARTYYWIALFRNRRDLKFEGASLAVALVKVSIPCSIA